MERLLTQDPSVIALRDNLAKLPTKDQSFAHSLLASVAKYGQPTPKQAEWIAKLAVRAATPPEPPKPAAVLDRIVAMFDKAKETLKQPRVRFVTEDKRKFVVSAAGADSRNPGWLYIKADSQYIGKVSPQGEYFMTRDADPTWAKSLLEFNVNPEQSAKHYGHETGECCFCGLTLTDERSVTAGYGPICAAKYGLAWGGTGGAQ